MSNVQQFIDLVGKGENALAQEALNDILSAKAFEALDSFKQSVGANLFATEEVVEEEAEQLDEISLKKGTDAYVERLRRGTYAGNDDDVMKHVHKAIDTGDRIKKMHGSVGQKAAFKAADDNDAEEHSSRGKEPKYVPMNKKGALKPNPKY